jgi:RecA-family ATPase
MKDLALDHSQNLLGNRWLEKGHGAFVFGPSGVGKSVVVIQASSLWGANMSAFDIRPARALRIIILQHEDSRNDVIEMAQLINHLELTHEQAMLLKRNVWIANLVGRTGDRFISALKSYISEFPPDLIIINPYSAYIGEGFQDDDKQKEFLYNKLSPVLKDHECGALIIAHTTKAGGSSQDDMTLTEYQYSMQGRAILTNWARAMLGIRPGDNESDQQRVFRFTATKRGERIGWKKYDSYWKWSANEMESKTKTTLWVPADAYDMMSAVPRNRLTPEGLLDYISFTDPLSEQEIYLIVNEKRKESERIGIHRVRAYLDILSEIAPPVVKRVEIFRSGTRPAIKYKRCPVK